jgi:hypothetical protein
MNEHFQKIANFYSALTEDSRIGPSHISLYMGLFYWWMKNGFDSPLPVSSTQMMRVSKISSRATYVKCIKNLHEYGYIKYVPSYNRFAGSLVYL